jgi:hypothetical protein
MEELGGGATCCLFWKFFLLFFVGNKKGKKSRPAGPLLGRLAEQTSQRQPKPTRRQSTEVRPSKELPT